MENNLFILCELLKKMFVDIETNMQYWLLGYWCTLSYNVMKIVGCLKDVYDDKPTDILNARKWI